MNVFERIRRPASTAAGFREKLAEIEEALPAAEAAARAAEQECSAGLLELPDHEMERIEARLARALRDRDRLRAAREEAERRAVEAERAEAMMRLNGQRSAAEEKAAKFVASIEVRFAQASKQLLTMAAEAEAIEQAVIDANEAARFYHADAGALLDAPAPLPRLSERLPAEFARLGHLTTVLGRQPAE